jgi:hypothetical protein
MAVYVDDMFRYPMGRLGRMKMSHMLADTEDELHAMADALNLPRGWFQGDHYDVALATRRRAVELGAQEITMRQAAQIRKILRIKRINVHEPPTPLPPSSL